MTDPPREAIMRQHYMERLARLQPVIAAYTARKPFAKARNSKEQDNRLNEARMCRELIANLDLPEVNRDPVAAYDISSFVKRYEKEKSQ